jgi:hypothetical protein
MEINLAMTRSGKVRSLLLMAGWQLIFQPRLRLLVNVKDATQRQILSLTVLPQAVTN